MAKNYRDAGNVNAIFRAVIPRETVQFRGFSDYGSCNPDERVDEFYFSA